jgi:hypothetical protein
MRTRLALLLVATLALAVPPLADAARPDIERVTVSREEDDRVTFKLVFAEPVFVESDDQIQVAIDADRDPGTGVDGLDYSLDKSVALYPGVDHATLLTAVDGVPVASYPPELRFGYEEGALGYGFSVSSVTFSVPSSMIGDPARFDFYVFIRVEGELDEAPSHVLFSAGALPWTYPKDDTPDVGEAYPTETYYDNSDFTLSEQPGLFIAVVVAFVLAVGGLLAVGGWGVQRLRKRNAGRP